MKKNTEYKNPRILVISNNAFSKTTNNGKTLASFFKAFPAKNISQLYFNNEIPSDNHYYNYFRVTDKEVITGLFNKKETGNIIEAIESDKKILVSDKNDKLINKIKKYDTARIGRELLWSFESWNNQKINKWLDEINPDIIFLCAGDTGFTYDIANYIQKRYNSKLVTYITDDYILPRRTISISWWIRRNHIIKKMEKILNKSDLFITISEEMRITYKKLFNKDSIIAMNMSESMKLLDIKNDNNEIKLIYAGGLHFKRYETLNLLAKGIKEYNLTTKNNKAFLKIYSSNEPDEKIKNLLNIHGVSSYCGSLTQKELKIALNKSDIPVHVESFDRKSIESTRLSISTKIPEYLSLGKPVLAIGPKEVASIKYLEDCAYCITNPGSINYSLKRLLENEDIKENLSEKALIKFNINHDAKKTLDFLTENIRELK